MSELQILGLVWFFKKSRNSGTKRGIMDPLMSKELAKNIRKTIWTFPKCPKSNMSQHSNSGVGWVFSKSHGTPYIQLIEILVEYPIPRRRRPPRRKTRPWRYLGNQERYHRSAGVKTTGKRILKISGILLKQNNNKKKRVRNRFFTVSFFNPSITIFY